jgi:anti-sigma B factor antagonist
MSMCVSNGQHEEPTVAWNRARRRPSELIVDTQHDGDAVIVAIAGEFELAAAAPVREAFTSAIREAPQRVTIDLGGVTFIDSSGLHTILDAHKLCRDVAPVLTIRPGPPNVQQIFELTNLVDRLPFETAG